MRILIPITLALLFPVGCAAGPPLPSENQHAELAALKAEAAARPTRLWRIPTKLDGGPVVRVALHETGSKTASRTIILLHGCLSDHHAWRFVSGELGSDSRLILVDLPGCGRSDKPSAQVMGERGYSPDALAERVLQALDARLSDDSNNRDNSPLTLVGHSLGGTIVLRMIGDASLRQKYSRVLDRVDRLVLLAPADLNMPNPPAIFQKIANVSGTEVTIADLTGILSGAIEKGTRQSYCDEARAICEESHRLRKMLLRADTRSAAQAILKQTLPRRNERPDWEALARIEADYENVQTPTLIVWGARDETLPVASGYKFAAMLPQATLLVVPDSMHSLHLEQPADCAKLIRGFSKDPLAFRSKVEPSDQATASARAGDDQPSPAEAAPLAGGPE